MNNEIINMSTKILNPLIYIVENVKKQSNAKNNLDLENLKRYNNGVTINRVKFDKKSKSPLLF